VDADGHGERLTAPHRLFLSAVAVPLGNLAAGLDNFRAGTRPAPPLICAFIGSMRERGFAVDLVCAVLREQGCQVAAGTYRVWKAGRTLAARTQADVVVINTLLATAEQPESRYGRRKMTAFLRRQGLQVAHCTVDRLMRELGMKGARRTRKVPATVPGRNGRRAGDLLDSRGDLSRSGMGLRLARQLCDHVAIRRGADGVTVRLTVHWS
jgi:hypothetical protein